MPIIKSIDDLQRKLDLYSKLAEAQGRLRAGEKGKPLTEVVQNIRNMIHESIAIPLVLTQSQSE